MHRDDEATAVARSIYRLVHWARRLAPGELSTTAATTLETLAAVGPTRISDLAESERVSQPAMTGLINRLTAAGLVLKASDQHDRRAALATITPAGRVALREREAQRADALRPYVDALPADSRATLAAALAAIDELIDADDLYPTTLGGARPQ